MFNVLCDTCIWLDLAQDQKQAPLIDPLVEMLKQGQMRLLVPRIVLKEFEKNRKKIADHAKRSLSSHFNAVKDAIRKVENDTKQKNRLVKYLSDVDHRIPLVGGAATNQLDRIEQILKGFQPTETTDDVKTRAAERALNRQAPCHLDKNSIADAVLIETYFACVRGGSPGDRFAFVTRNKSDFSGLSSKLVHQDLAPGFSKIKSLYVTSLGDLMRRIDPDLVRDVIFEHTFTEEVRSLSDITDAMSRLLDQIWYNRHKNLARSVYKGKHKIVTREVWEANWRRKKVAYSQTHTIDSVWLGALKAAKRVERQLGKENCGPWTDFEWGMLNGKLSALRWALGDEWDMLDT